jgi:hypothetical protein
MLAFISIVKSRQAFYHYILFFRLHLSFSFLDEERKREKKREKKARGQTRKVSE